MVLVYCAICNKEMKVFPSRAKRTQFFYCSREHRSEHFKTRFLGEDNPNYNKKWSKSRKEEQSKIIKKAMDSDEIRQKCSKGMKGKTWSKEHLEKYRASLKYRVFPKHTEESKKLIGIRSSEKFTDEYKRRMRKKNVESGLWVDPKDKPDYEIYFKLAAWDSNMFEYLIEDKVEMVNSVGLFNARKNSTGLVRDHIFPRHKGFEWGVFPEILKHPVNCQFIPHGENVRRRFMNFTRNDLELFFEKVLAFDGEYDNHRACIQLITKYNNGHRWKRKEGQENE